MALNTIPVELDVRMFLRLLVSALVGYERECAGKLAGVRTCGMVSLGAALFAVVSPLGFGSAG